jgi:hypothetical protein
MEKKPFRIGLCMAGAVSAGAYTAGVMDYLIEALEAWEKQKQSGNPNVPSHEVRIPVMGGASAGGMTALLAASTINNSITPVEVPSSDPDRNRYFQKLTAEHPENKLYHSWVDLTHQDMFPKMLENSDIDAKGLKSILNSNFIDEIADKMLCCDSRNFIATPPYFEKPVKVFTTLTNLQGFSYYAGFRAMVQKEKYNMSVHNDYACFEIFGDMKDGDMHSPGWMPLNFKTRDFLDVAKQSAMATGAFPVGLRSRVLTREMKYVKDVPWLKYLFDETAAEDQTQTITTLNVDGGTINNEPYEKVRDVLDAQAQGKDVDLLTETERRTLLEHNCNYATFENTVLMVDPFPSTEQQPIKMTDDLMNVIPNTLSAMLSQMRAKPAEYKAAMVSGDASRFIVSPSRRITNSAGQPEEVFGEKAIACGTLAGFGGFLSKEFRIHDYYLGRYNCEIFLRDYFNVPEGTLTDNPIFSDGYAGVDKKLFESRKEPGRYQIIPIFEPAPPENTIKMPKFSCGDTWPKLKPQDIDRFAGATEKRVGKIIMTVSGQSGFKKWLLQLALKIFGANRKLAEKALDYIKDSLKKWDLIH